MPNLSHFILPFVVALLLGISFSKIAEVLAIKNKLLPRLRVRDSHLRPLPRIGGLAIFAAFLIVSVAWFLFVDKDFHFTKMNILGIDRRLLGIWLAGLIICVVMILDDLKGISAPVKLLIQVLVALIIIASGVGIDFISNPFGQPINLNSVYIPVFSYKGLVYHFSLWSDLLTMIWLVGMMNVINFIDGIDGLAAGISGIAAFTIFILAFAIGQPAIALIAIILAGSALGFLVLNFPPAKIFMGDSGSMFLGLMLGVLPLISGGKLATSFLVLGFPIVDGLVVALGRILRGKNPMTTPDKTHLHHRFISAGFSIRQAVISMYVIAALFGWVALRGTTRTKLEAGGILVILLVGLILVLNQKSKSKSQNCNSKLNN